MVPSKLYETRKKINFTSLFFGTKKERANMHVGGVQIKESDDEKLLGITLDKKLSLRKHVQTLCRKPVKSFLLFLALQSTWDRRD